MTDYKNLKDKPVHFVMREGDGKHYTEVGGTGNPWDDLFIAAEGIGLLIRMVEKEGYFEHHGQTVLDHVKELITHSYQASHHVGRVA